MDRHVTPIAMVFDELKDYLSESDLSLDYKIARSRNKKKKLLTNRNSKIFNGDVVVKPQQGEFFVFSATEFFGPKIGFFFRKVVLSETWQFLSLFILLA